MSVIELDDMLDWKSLQLKHATLVDKVHQADDPTRYVREAQRLLDELQSGIRTVTDPDQRRRLQFYTSNWNNFVSQQTEDSAAETADDQLNAVRSVAEPIEDQEANPVVDFNPLPDNKVRLVRKNGDHSITVFLRPDTAIPEWMWRQDFRPLLKQRLLRTGDVGLYSPPGAGKSTLVRSLMYDVDLWNAFPDGMLYTRLGRYPDMVAKLGEWARALGVPIRELATHDCIESLKQAIRKSIGMKRILLVIDNAESIQEALAFRCGGLYCSHILATDDAQAAISFAGEGFTAVPPLSQSDALRIMRSHVPNWVEMNPDLAQRLVPHFSDTPFALTLVSRFLERQSRFWSGNELDMLKQSSSFPMGDLISPSRGASAAIELCETQLSAAVQTAIRTIAVFPPSPSTFDLAAISAVTNIEEDLLIPIISKLTTTGLLQDCGNNRYMLHKLVGDYYQTKNMTDGITATANRDRFIRYWVDFTEERCNEEKVHRPEFNNAVRLEFGNIISALNSAAEQGVRGEGRDQQIIDTCRNLIRGVKALFPYLENSGLYSMADAQLRRASEAARLLSNVSRASGEHITTALEYDDDVDFAKILMYQARIAEKRGLNERAIDLLRSALTQLRAPFHSASEWLRSEILCTLGVVFCNIGEYSVSQTYLVDATEQAENAQQPYLLQISHCLNRLTVLETNRGKFVQAIAYAIAGLKRARAIRNDREIAGHRLNIGVIYDLENKQVKANKLLNSGLRLAQIAGDREKETGILHALGEVARKQNRYEEAHKLLAQALNHASEIGHTWYASIIRCEIGNVYLYQNMPDRAGSEFQKALEEAHTKDVLAFVQWGLARVNYSIDRQESLRLAITGVTLLDGIGHFKARWIRSWIVSNFEHLE